MQTRCASSRPRAGAPGHAARARHGGAAGRSPAARPQERDGASGPAHPQGRKAGCKFELRSAGAGVIGRAGKARCSFILSAQVHLALAFGRIQSMASSFQQICRSSPVKAVNSFPRAASIARLPAHLENGLHYWHQAASLATDNLHVLPVPKSRNRVSHSFLIQAPYWLFSKAWPRLDYAWHRVPALLHLDRRAAHAIHRLSIVVPNTPAQAFSQALFSPKKEVQPSNGELPSFLLLRLLVPPAQGRAQRYP
jgi:hypothetical protein